MEIRTPLTSFRGRLRESRVLLMGREEYESWKEELEAQRAEVRARFAAAEYEREDLAWYRESVTEHFTFMYDSSFYDPEKGYRIDEFLDHGEAEFGGYDILLLWQAYPRIGCDQRNQFDFYRDMPGGLPGIRRVADRCHERGVRVFIDYNPWDTGTRREGRPDHEALAEIVAAIDADGIFLDTMSASGTDLREALDAVKPGVVFETEGSPSFEAAAYVTGSWASFNPILGPYFFWNREFPFVFNTHLTMRWVETRHSVRVLERHSHHRRFELIPGFFNGAGAVVWENVFGWWNPWSPEDRRLVRKIAAILRRFKDAFQSPAWQPMVPTENERLAANEWPGRDETVWTLVNTGFERITGELLAVPCREGARYFDVWNGSRELAVRREGGLTHLALALEARSAGCVVESRSGASISLDLGRGSRDHPVSTLRDHRPKPPPAVPARSGNRPDSTLEQMVEIPAGRFRWQIQHRQWEGACYDDISYCWANEHRVRTVDMKALLMDRFPVTNAELKRFLEESGYEPAEKTNFLKHWVDGEIPEGKERHPVVYVDLTDARAYAAWAGKRLPTEEEWQYAAQGADGRLWPWGDEEPAADTALCNGDTENTTPVDAFPKGQSPFGVWDMAGNAWELTESERDDGHTRYVMLKGGSYFKATGSRWYFDGGAQRPAVHAKFLLMWPGLDRSATVGFRCVREKR